MIRPATIAVCAALTLGACGGAVISASPERDADTDALVADVGAGRYEVVVGKMSSAVPPEQVRAQLPFLKNLIPAGPVPAGQTAGWQAFAGTGGMTYALNRTYDYPDRTLAVASTFRKEGEVWKVLNFNINVQIKAGVPPPTEPASDLPVVADSEKAA